MQKGIAHTLVCLDCAKRRGDLETILKEHEVSFLCVGHIYGGPKHDRNLAKLAYVEFTNGDVSKIALTKLGGKGKQFAHSSGISITIAPAISGVNRKRNWSLKKASELLKVSSYSHGTITRIDW